MLFRSAADPATPAELAQFWDLSALQAGYRAVLDRFGPLESPRCEALSDGDALVARLLLVHVYRNVVLRDPRLPQAVLPSDWQGHAARALFRRLYRRLSPAAERHIAGRFEGVDGYLPARTPESEARLAGLV